jgi:hypothetical protein
MNIATLAIFILGLLIGFLLGRYVKFGGKTETAGQPAAAPAQGITVQAVNGKGRSQSVNLAPELLAELHDLLQAGQKAEAAQRVREACGLDGITSKAIVDALQNMMH